MTNQPDRYERFVVPAGTKKCALASAPAPRPPAYSTSLVGLSAAVHAAAPSWHALSPPHALTALPRRVEYCLDTKMANAATFVIQREDHTVGNLIRMKLHEDNRVWFAGYKIPHPLEHRLLVKVRTNGQRTPVAAYNTAIDECVHELQVRRV